MAYAKDRWPDLSKVKLEISMSGKVKARPGTVCWSCKHFHFQGGDAGYSEYTPGYSASMYCGKNEWHFDFDNASQADLEKTLKTAETCPRFEQRS